MPSYIYTAKDRKTGDVLCKGSPGECAEVIGCTENYVWALSGRKNALAPWSKFWRFAVEREWDVEPEVIQVEEGTHNTHCLDCGKFLGDVVSQRMRCPECALKRRKKNDRQRQRERRGLSQEACNSLDQNREQVAFQKACEGCVYFDGISTLARTCNFIFREGHSRGCPPGKGCTKRKERTEDS